MQIKPPFPWFGGKSRVAKECWSRFGEVKNYVEPFFGSGAMLLSKPGDPCHTETVNDADGLLANFWRGMTRAPDEVIAEADWPVNEADLHARHLWLIGQREPMLSKLMANEAYFDARAAGWWVWGQSCWIGSGWCSGVGPWHAVDGEFVKRPRSGDAGTGIHRQRPHCGGNGTGTGIHRKRPHCGNNGTGIHRKSRECDNAESCGCVAANLGPVAQRMRHVRVMCGDWSRCVTPTVTHKHGLTAVFLDPPYSRALREECYSVGDDGSVAAECLEWCKKNGDNPKLRIALCGYDSEHNELEALGWTVFAWKATGFNAKATSENRAEKNRGQERIWFSPHCIQEES